MVEHTSAVFMEALFPLLKHNDIVIRNATAGIPREA